MLELLLRSLYCLILSGRKEHSAILWTFIRLTIVIQIFVLSIFEWAFYTGFTVGCLCTLYIIVIYYSNLQPVIPIGFIMRENLRVNCFNLLIFEYRTKLNLGLFSHYTTCKLCMLYPPPV